MTANSLFRKAGACLQMYMDIPCNAATIEMTKKEIVQMSIERLRLKLNSWAASNSNHLCTDEMLVISRELDEMIIHYYMIINDMR
jgi:hypothetical protein